MTTRSAHNPRTGLEEPLARIEVFESTANLIKSKAGSRRDYTIPDAAQDLLDPVVEEKKKASA